MKSLKEYLFRLPYHDSNINHDVRSWVVQLRDRKILRHKEQARRQIFEKGY